MSNFHDFTDDLQRTEERRRSQKIGDKTYTIRCEDPYGMWFVEGTKDKSLDGKFTSAEQLWQHIKSFEDSKALLAKNNNAKKTSTKE